MKYCNFLSMMILVATNLPNAARAFGEDDHLQAEVCKMADRCALVTVFLSLVLSNLYILLHIMIHLPPTLTLL